MQIYCVSNFSRWLDHWNIPPATIDEQTLQRYLAYRRRRKELQRGDAAALQRFLELLRQMEVLHSRKEQAKLSHRARVIADFGSYLRQERQLSEATLKNYLPTIDQFLFDRFKDRHIDVSRIQASNVIEFVQSQARVLSAKRAQTLVTSLRSFLRYLLHQGQIPTDLAACVPTVPAWSFSTLPKFLPPGAVQKVLRQCNRQTAAGRRDYAILLLLARLGLRGGEVVALNLGDIDWGAGTITVHGKGGRSAQLPLPSDVGRALAAYLKRDRPRCPSRSVFIRQNAPHKGFANSIAISTLVMRYLRKSGIESARKGAHLFRHTLATDLLRQGCSLDEIGELLRHRSPDTTAIYAKVDLQALRGLALPWPGGAR
jgi:site-specific recombinase XerD